jgi:hypothetical protein
MSLPPDDEDLQDLYDQVLAGFADETFPDLPTPYGPSSRPPNNDRDLDTVVSSYEYGDEPSDSKLNRTPSFNTSASDLFVPEAVT